MRCLPRRLSKARLRRVSSRPAWRLLVWGWSPCGIRWEVEGVHGGRELLVDARGGDGEVELVDAADAKLDDLDAVRRHARPRDR